jgi:hypothetical protein
MAAPQPDDLLERLYLQRGTVRHLAREVRNLSISLARTIEMVEARDTSESQEAHANDRHQAGREDT